MINVVESRSSGSDVWVRWNPAVLVALLFGIVFGGIANATDDDNTIHACANDRTGGVRIVDSSAACRSNESPLDWNIQGPQGAQGPQGEQGPEGAEGARGPAGESGPLAAQQWMGRWQSSWFRRDDDFRDEVAQTIRQTEIVVQNPADPFSSLSKVATYNVILFRFGDCGPDGEILFELGPLTLDPGEVEWVESRLPEPSEFDAGWNGCALVESDQAVFVSGSFRVFSGKEDYDNRTLSESHLGKPIEFFPVKWRRFIP